MTTKKKKKKKPHPDVKYIFENGQKMSDIIWPTFEIDSKILQQLLLYTHKNAQVSLAKMRTTMCRCEFVLSVVYIHHRNNFVRVFGA